MTEKQILARLSGNFHNYSANQSAFGFSADDLASNPELAKLVLMLSAMQGGMNFDADAMGFDADAMAYMGNTAFGYNQGMFDKNFLPNTGQYHYTPQQIASAQLTTFFLRVRYIPGPGPTHAPVRIQLFGMSWGIKPTINPEGNLVFSNALGDTVLVQGITRSMEQLYDLTDTEPFRLAFMRVTPQSISQLDNAVRVEEQTQWDSGKYNNINPSIYNDPYQYQQLNIDVPVNVVADKKNGLQWDIQEDQTGAGMGIALFISQQLKPSESLKGKDPIRNLNNGVTPTFNVPGLSSAGEVKQALTNMAASPAIRQVLANSPLIRTRG